MALLLTLVMLSICSVSAAPPQPGNENEIILTKPAVDKPPSVLNQQQRFGDINSVLIDIFIQLAELKGEMKYLQRQNEEQSTTLKELELQMSELEKLQPQVQQQQQQLQQHQQQLQQQQQQDIQQQQQLQEQKKQLQQQQQQLQQQQLQLQQQQQQDTQQQQQIQTHAAELVAIKTKANITEKQLEALEKDREVKQVAFSTSMVTSGVEYRGPFSTDTTLIFRKEIENIGNTYDPHTGFFTAPVRGAYHFEVHIYGVGHPSHPAGVWLVKNGQPVCIAYEHQPTHAAGSSNGATLLLDAGDVVFLRLLANSWLYDNANHHNTFSGHLLFTMQ